MNIIDIYLYGCHSHKTIRIDLDAVKRIFFYYGLEECILIELKDGSKKSFEAGWDHVQGFWTCVYDSEFNSVCLPDELRYIMDPKRRGECPLIRYEDFFFWDHDNHYFYGYKDEINPYLDYVVPYKRNRVKDNRHGRKALHKRYLKA